jgi:hypothetical protein
MKSGTVKDMNTPLSFIWVIILFEETFKCGDGAKFWGYVGADVEALCVEFCNIVQCHIIVNCFNCVLHNAGKAGVLVISRTSCYFSWDNPNTFVPAPSVDTYFHQWMFVKVPPYQQHLAGILCVLLVRNTIHIAAMGGPRLATKRRWCNWDAECYRRHSRGCPASEQRDVSDHTKATSVSETRLPLSGKRHLR